MEYQFKNIEKKWKNYWKENLTFKTLDNYNKPKYYVLDMFPYPSGAGLHVGHPLGYIASDIIARYKILKGFNVLHPMGFDSFGLPGEQYAIQTGQHPAVTTKKNIETFKTQMDNISFCYDWSREVQTSDPNFYKWTQYIFIQLFNSWFDRRNKKAANILELKKIFEQEGSKNINWLLDKNEKFTADEWKIKNEKQQANILMKFRLAFQEEAIVNWCEKLGTVLANDEVVNGVSERGGYPVERKKMTQWFLRITEYADRLLEGLEQVDFSDSMKEIQRNWIGKSSGAEIKFNIQKEGKILNEIIEVYTTRPDTIFGVDFITLAPEHELINIITTDTQKNAINEYLKYVKSRSDVERMAETKQVSGCFTGSFVIHPFTKKLIPIWVGEYVLIGYGTGAVIAVPCGDDRDHLFAKHFNLPITNIWGDLYDGNKAYTEKYGKVQNSDFLSGIEAKEAMELAIKKLEELKIGKKKINFKMRDAGFSRQRYWGEPFPIVYKNEIAQVLQENELPLLLPHLDNFKLSGKNGKGPLSNLTNWVNFENGVLRETDTMPGYAGSSWYFLRYMDPHNDKNLCDKNKSDYWNQVDLYVGGTEHAVGHLLYSRFWTKVLYDLNFISFDEPYKKLLNQGKITGTSKLIYRVRDKKQLVSFGLKDKYITDEIHIDVNIVDGTELDLQEFKNIYLEYNEYEIILENGKYFCGTLVEKMSKSKFNTVNPDELVNKFGADTFRLYEMFLGPIQQSKPWDTKGIEGTHRFIKKLWRLFFDEVNNKNLITQEAATNEELKILHKTIKKIEEDMERFSFNTSVSSFMIAINSLSEIKCHKKQILEPILILLAPFTPHVCEELWNILGNKETIFKAPFPKYDEKFLNESEKNYPIAINGKVKMELSINLEASQEEVEKIIKENIDFKKYLDGKEIKKIIYAKGRMINVVV